MLITKLHVTMSIGIISRGHSCSIIGKCNFMKMRGKSYFFSNQTNVDHCSRNKGFYKSLNKHSTFLTPTSAVLSSHSISRQSFSSKSLHGKFDLQETADVFGDLGGNKYEKIDMDEFEIQEEEFLMNEAKKPRGSVPSPGQYAKMIKQHITSGDLKAGLQVLEQIKKDRSIPNNYMYNLLIRAFGMQGNLKTCFSLYNQMKKRGLKPTMATYVSLLNVCAICTDTKLSLDKLNHLRQMLIEQGVELNPACYNVMIKAYGRHGKLLEAFQLVDEMRDKKVFIGTSTFNILLQGTISDKEAGFRHALITWQLLKSRKLKPDIFTYNLLLRSARDCKLGNFKIEDLLISAMPEKTTPQIMYSDRTNLLAQPPVLGQCATLIGDSRNPEVTDSHSGHPQSIIENTKLVADNKSDSMLVPTIGNTDTVINLESSSPELNLLLMGGIKNFTALMKEDNVQPDIKTVTFLMELIPSTLHAEDALMKYAKAMGIQLDIDFYNLLIRKRSFRYDYKNALRVMRLMQEDNLEPNIMTWGVLALTCRSSAEVKKLFEGMELSGQRTNVQIIGAILNQASKRWLFGLILEMMEKMRLEDVKPNQKIYDILESFREKAIKASKNKESPDFMRKPFWQNGFRKFNRRYPIWLKEMKANEEGGKKKSI